MDRRDVCATKYYFYERNLISVTTLYNQKTISYEPVGPEEKEIPAKLKGTI
jgi:hypothetical protein